MTIYRCLQTNTNGTMEIKHEASTEIGALSWLSQNGGGVYHNILHKFKLKVNPDDYRFWHKVVSQDD